MGCAKMQYKEIGQVQNGCVSGHCRAAANECVGWVLQIAECDGTLGCRARIRDEGGLNDRGRVAARLAGGLPPLLAPCLMRPSESAILRTLPMGLVVEVSPVGIKSL